MLEKLGRVRRKRHVIEFHQKNSHVRELDEIHGRVYELEGTEA